MYKAMLSATSVCRIHPHADEMPFFGPLYLISSGGGISNFLLWIHPYTDEMLEFNRVSKRSRLDSTVSNAWVCRLELEWECINLHSAYTTRLVTGLPVM